MTLHSRCESPIETEMLTMLMSMLGNRVRTSEARTMPMFRDHVMANENFGNFVVGAQVKVLGYRTDIVVGVRTETNGPHVIVIECDGWEHHGQWWQRKRDGLRDAAMLKSGLIEEVRRYAGRDINARAIEICMNIRAALSALAVQLPTYLTTIDGSHPAALADELWSNDQWDITELGLVGWGGGEVHLIPWHAMDDNNWVHVMAKKPWVDQTLFNQAFYLALTAGARTGHRVLGRSSLEVA